MLASSFHALSCFKFSPKTSTDLQGTVSCSLDSRLPDLEKPLPASGDVVITIDPCCTHQGDFPPDVLLRIVRLASRSELKFLHRVNRAWRDAVCQGLGVIVVRKSKANFLPQFPNVMSLALERVDLDYALIAELKTLQTLVLRDCAFDCGYPDLGCLKGLKKLRLQDVDLATAGDSDTMLAQMTSLTFLEWTRKSPSMGTSESERVPMPSLASLSKLVALEELIVSDTYAGSQIQHLSGLAALQQLRKLSITRGVMREGITAAISLLPDLVELNLISCTNLGDTVLPAVSALTGLTKLDMRWTGHATESEVTDRGLGHLHTLRSLKHLNLAGHRGLTSEGVAFLSHLTDLTSLCLAGVGLWTDGAAFLGSLTSLQSLNISKSLLTAEQLHVLGRLPGLQTLNISETYFNDNSAPQVAAMTNLETLKIGYCPLGNKGFKLITASCPRLTRVTTEGCWLSTLCILFTVIHYPRLNLWRDDKVWLPLWMRKIDVILIAQTQPYHRKLRAFYQAEESVVLSLFVGLGVLVVVFVYTSVLLLICTVVLLFPIFIVGILFMLVLATAISVRALSQGSLQMPRAIQELERFLFSSRYEERESRQQRLDELL